MPKRNRQTLKECFKEGKKPSELDFENLIDSTINILDDGFSKQADTGMALSPIQGNHAVISVFREAGDDRAAWEIAIDPDSGSLKINRCHTEISTTIMTLDTDGNIELGETGGEIIVKGDICATGRKGGYIKGKVPADGRWHDITTKLEGCWALEVIAGSGRKNTGKHALLVATAVHCFGAKRQVKKVSSHYGISGNRIRLRWKRSGFACTLQIRTSFNFGPGVDIDYNISRLWDKPYMETV